MFYPEDFTSGCTTQQINVQRNLTNIRAARVEPFGLSADDAESHKQFCDAYELEFGLLVDEHYEAERAYGAVKAEDGIPGSVLVVEQDGKILFAQEGGPSWQEVLDAMRPANDGDQSGV